ncbi:MAG: phosphotransferase family protein, partial [Actinobacteria bacterium]|nr:phosphotransferase family protein [Actinomycetota bacterium]
RCGPHDLVVRRPPLGPVLETANDVLREHRVQAALAGSGIPVARMVASEDDPTVLGAPFYVMEMLDGVVYSDADAVRHLDIAEARDATWELIDTLARLHAVDPQQVGLGDLGRPDGFTARQVRRWQRQWGAAKQRELPAIDEVAARLERAVPVDDGPAIVHGDYSFNNTMWHRDQPARMQAVLDWEMATLGDALTDVGMLATYWGPVGELLWRNRVAQPHRANPGFPDVDAVLERYARTSGRDLEAIDFYRVLATFKLAVISEGAHARVARAAPERAPAVRATVDTLAAAALDLAAASSLPELRGRRRSGANP